MAQIKIYGLTTHLNSAKPQISAAIHAAVTEVLRLPADKKFQRFIGMEKDDFIFPADRSDRYIIIEVLLFEGRTEVTLKEFIKRVISNLKDQAGIDPQDVEITLVQTPKYAWGIRGKTGDELGLNYKVDV